MKRIVVLAALAVGGLAGGCQTTDQSNQQAANSWKGRPVREFAEYRSLVPVSYHDTDTGRTYIFETVAPMGNRCGITVRSVPGVSAGATLRHEYVITGFTTNCPGLLM